MKYWGALLIPLAVWMGCSEDSSSSGAALQDTQPDTSIVSSSGNSSEEFLESSGTHVSSSSRRSIASSSATKSLASSSSSADWHDDCLELVNSYRATENLSPLQRATAEREACAQKQAAKDLAENKPHGNFGSCGESAQNSGPNVAAQRYNGESAIAASYIRMMWEDEKALVKSGERDPEKSEDYSYIGHYLNMKNTRYHSLACGISYSADGKLAWFNMNFY